MKRIKNFESFDFSETLPITSKNFLTNFYSCDECDHMWKEFNNTTDKCRYCNSNEIEELQEDEWYELAKSKTDEEGSRQLNKEKSSDSDDYVDLLSLKRGSKDVN